MLSVFNLVSCKLVASRELALRPQVKAWEAPNVVNYSLVIFKLLL